MADTDRPVQVRALYDLQYEHIDYGDIKKLEQKPLSASFQIMCDLKLAFKANDLDKIIGLYHEIQAMKSSTAKDCAIAVWDNEMRVQYVRRGIK